MSSKIFYSWQADTPGKINRHFLREVLDTVCAEFATDTEIGEAARDVSVDSDTQGVAGQPPIAETIFRKIDAAAVFIADMTFVGFRHDERPTPNPNVLIEYGWALKSLTTERVICVMNTAYGEPSYENLPFDLAHLRWPIRYNLPENSTPAVRLEQKKLLSKSLKEAILLSLGTVPIPVAELPPPFPEAESKDGPARFRVQGEALGYEDDQFRDETREVFLVPGPTMWLRLIPSSNPQKKWSVQELRSLAMKGSLLMPILNGWGTGHSFLKASDGAGMYRADGKSVARFNDSEQPNPNGLEVSAITFAFRTGEIWSIDSALQNYAPKWLHSTELEKHFVSALGRYAQFLKELGVEEPYWWKAGITGTKGRMLIYPAPPQKQWINPDRGPVCTSDLIEAEGVYEFTQPATTALLPFFQAIFEECTTDRPDYLPQ